MARPENADGGRDSFTLSDDDALRRETSVLTDVYAEFSDIDARIDGRTMSVTLTSGNFFEVVLSDQIGLSRLLRRARHSDRARPVLHTCEA